MMRPEVRAAFDLSSEPDEVRRRYGTGIFVFFLFAAPGVAALIGIGLFVLAVHYVVLLARTRAAITRVLASAREVQRTQ